MAGNEIILWVISLWAALFFVGEVREDR